MGVITTPIFDTFTPEVQRLLSLIEGNLHFIAGLEMTREQAIAVKHRMSLPLGSLGSKHDLRPSRNAKTVHRVAMYQKTG